MYVLNLPPERQVILLLTNQRLQNQELHYLDKLITSALNWNQIIIESLWHKVSFLVFARLKQLKLLNKALTQGNLPLLLLNHWKQLFYANYERNNLYLSELSAIDIALKNAGIEYAVSKGGALLFGRAYTLYERKIYDIDIIAHKRDLTIIENCFANLGYKHFEYNHDDETFSEIPKEEFKKWLLFTRGLPNFVKPVNIISARYLVIQVQFKIGSTKSGEKAIPAKPLLNEAINYTHCRGVGNEDLLIQLILHIYRETTEESFKEWNMDWNLIKFCDLNYLLHYLVSNKEFNDKKFYCRVTQLDFLKEAVYSLILTNYVYPSEIYGTIIKNLVGNNNELINFINNLEDLYAKNITSKIFAVGYYQANKRSGWSNLMLAKTT